MTKYSILNLKNGDSFHVLTESADDALIIAYNKLKHHDFTIRMANHSIKQKVYVVLGSSEFNEAFVERVFSTKEKALRYLIDQFKKQEFWSEVSDENLLPHAERHAIEKEIE